jgi:hypothetical protein
MRDSPEGIKGRNCPDSSIVPLREFSSEYQTIVLQNSYRE